MSIHQYHNPQQKPPLQSPEEDKYFDFHMSEEGRKAFTDLMLSLTALRLRNVSLQWDTIVFSDQLVDLHLQSVVLSESFLLDELPDVLRSAPNLRNLKFISVVALPPTRNHPPPVGTALPKLETLFLADLFDSVLSYIICSIAPGSYRTKLGLTRTSWTSLRCRETPEGELDPDAGWDEEGPEESIVHDVLTYSRYDTLILGPDIFELQSTDETTLHMILELVPALKSLVVIGWNWNDGLIRVLERPDSDQPFPHLNELYILDSSIEDAEYLLDVATSHSLQTLVVDSPDSLISTEGDHEDIIQRLRDVVPDLRFVGGSEHLSELDYRSWRLW